MACPKTKKAVCIDENFYTIINEAHTNVSHGDRDKTTNWILGSCIEILLKQCVACQTRKPIKHHVVTKPTISLGVMTRLQIDLIDMRTRPDKISSDFIYCWILNCIDHFSEFSWMYPLKNKLAVEMATKLREYWFTFGPPKILHSDNRREFISSVMCGRSRHPQSQGCVERANGVLCDALSKWMSIRTIRQVGRLVRYQLYMELIQEYLQLRKQVHAKSCLVNHHVLIVIFRKRFGKVESMMKKIYLHLLIHQKKKPITIIEAARLYLRRSATGRTCNCKDQYATKTCPCKKENVFCSIKCHSERDG